MLEVRVNNDALDLRADTVISYTLNNAVFSGSDTSQLPGSYSFPFNIPPTGRNLRILGYPTYINSAETFTPQPCELFLNGNRIPFTGKLSVQSATNDNISVYVVATAMTDLKDLKLKDLPLGGIRQIGSLGQVIMHARQTTQDPLDFDYIFFPVLNRNWLPEKPRYYFMNRWDNTAQTFTVGPDNPAFMPFIRIDYLLSQIFAATGYAFSNEFQVTDELKQLVLINIYSMYSREQMQSYINLQNHVPDITGADFVRRIGALFCLGFFTDTFGTQIRLVPLRRVLEAAPVHDWTSKAFHTQNISYQVTEVPATFLYATDPNDKVFEQQAKMTKPSVFTEIQNTDDIIGQPTGEYYYIIANNEYWLNDITRPRVVYWDWGSAPEIGKPGVKTRKAPNTPPVLEASLVPLLDIHDYLNTGTFTNTQIPIIDQAGFVTWQNGLDENDDPIWVEQKNPNPVRFTCYRGMVIDGQANNYPLGSGLRYGPLGQVLGDYSMRWDREDGIYAQWWERWHNMLGSRSLTRKFKLSLTDLVAFRFDEKVRVDNLDYFVQSMKITITMRGIEPVEATMLSVI